MPKFADGVLQSTATTGTGTLTLGAALSGGHRRIADVLTEIPDGSTVRYSLRQGNSREVGLGTTGASGTTLTRSITGPGCWSTTGALLNLAAGGASLAVTFSSLDWRNGCLLGRSSNLTGLNGAQDITWNVENYDDAGWFDAGTPTIVTVPAGVDRVRVNCNITSASVDDGVSLGIQLRLNGADFDLRAAASSPKLSTFTQAPRLSFATGGIPVSPGNTLSVRGIPNPTDTSWDVQQIGSNFAVESC